MVQLPTTVNGATAAKIYFHVDALNQKIGVA